MSNKRKETSETPSDWDTYLANLKKANHDRIEERKKLESNPNDDKIKLYKKQKEALNNESYDNIFDEIDKKTFAREISASGAREFIVMKSNELFYKEYITLDIKNHYEIIVENEPCHLYFDIEYIREYNPHLDGRSDKILEVLYDQIIFEIKRQLNINSSREDVLELDSSTSIKFSKHLIWHLKDHYFKNNEQVGKFIRNFFGRIRPLLDLVQKKNIDEDDSDENDRNVFKNMDQNDIDIIQFLFVYDDRGERNISVIDESVYSKNRMFRLYLSSKFGKDAKLVLSSGNRYPIESKESGDINKEVFMASLVTNVESNSKPLTIELDSNALLYEKTKKSDSLSSTEIDLKQESGYPSLDKFIRNYIINRGGKKTGIIKSITKSILTFSINNNSNNNNSNSVDNVVNNNSNSIDDFEFDFSSLDEDNNSNNINNNNNEIKEISILKYYIGGNRFCENIDREHKSNNIYFQVNLNSKTLHQRCFDRDCRNFKSKEIDISKYL